MKLYGLIGYPLSHSFSKKYFAEKFQEEKINECSYELFALEHIEEIIDLLAINPNCAGLNVTIPYKESVMKYLDELDEAAEAVGAVNTILLKDGKRKGFNTDIVGFKNSLEPLLQKQHYSGALILGSGGASKGVQYVCQKLGIPFKIISRKNTDPVFSYEALTKNLPENYYLIINTTPVGMSPNENNAPAINYAQLDERYLLYDLVYNPSKTKFLAQGEAKGTQIKNGFEMLEMQAEASWDIWNQNP